MEAPTGRVVVFQDDAASSAAELEVEVARYMGQFVSTSIN